MGAIAKVKIENEMKMFVGQRKHVSQMSSYEKSSLLKRLKSLNHENLSISHHTLDRIGEKGIKTTVKEISSTMYNCEIIEYKIDEKYNRIEERLVVKSKSVVNGRYNLIVVYNLTRKGISTVWINETSDRHSTLKWEIYNKNMKVFNI